MSKKHFIALAANLRSQCPENALPGIYEQWEADVSAVAEVCARFSPRFDRARFLAACGVESAIAKAKGE